MYNDGPSAIGLEIDIALDQVYILYVITIVQCFRADDHNVRTVRLDFDDGSSQEVSYYIRKKNCICVFIKSSKGLNGLNFTMQYITIN